MCVVVSEWDAFNHSGLLKAYLLYVLIPNKGVIGGNGKPQQPTTASAQLGSSVRNANTLSAACLAPCLPDNF